MRRRVSADRKVVIPERNDVGPEGTRCLAHAVGVLGMLVCVACSGAPREITTIKSPTDGVYYTVETWTGEGAIVNNWTEVNAHLKRGGRSDKKLVLEVSNADDTKIVWINSYEARICIPAGGVTATFRNQVTLADGDASVTLHNQLREDC